MARSRSDRKHKYRRSSSRHRHHRHRSDSSDLESYSRKRHNSRSSYDSRDKDRKRNRQKKNRKRSYRRRDSYSSESRSYNRKGYSRSRSSSEEERRHKKKRKHHQKKNKYRSYNSEKKKSKYESVQSASPGKYDSEEDDKDRSKDAGHYKFTVGKYIKDYKVISLLGDGTFGRVLEVEHAETKKRYAMKVIRAVDRYVDSAMTEADILKDINKKDPKDEHRIVRMETSFLRYPDDPKREQNYFMVFERLGMSLYEFLKMNNYKGFQIDNLQSISKQLFEAIGFMHSIQLTHTDLKPENILLVNDDFDEITIPPESRDDRSSTCSNGRERKFKKPKNDSIKIIDMGGATYEHDHHSSVINTRQYRAPEVMLECCAWSHSSDLWSIGCILLELYSGDLFFETHETYEHLAMIDKARGPIPYWMANKAEKKLRKHFSLDQQYFDKNGTYFDWPKHASDIESINRVKEMKMIDDVIPEKYPEFRDLLKKMLTVDPKLRITCDQALDHAFFKVDYSNSRKIDVEE